MCVLRGRREGDKGNTLVLPSPRSGNPLQYPYLWGSVSTIANEYSYMGLEKVKVLLVDNLILKINLADVSIGCSNPPPIPLISP